MRRLVIVCRPQDRAEIDARVKEYAHPGVVNDFVKIWEIDVNVDDPQDTALAIMNEGHSSRIPRGATNGQPLVVATKEVGEFLNMGSHVFGIQYQEHPAAKLRRHYGKRHECALENLLQTCGLTVVPAAAFMLRGYAHTDPPIDAFAINEWLAQFRRLKVGKYGVAVLRQIRLMDQATLGMRIPV